MLDIVASSVTFCSFVLGVFCSVIFMTTVIRHHQCHTTTIMLAFNTNVAGLICNLAAGIEVMYQLASDKEDYLCLFRGYLFHASTGLLYHTLCIQAIHRTFVIVLASRKYLQSKLCISILVIVQWIISICFFLPLVFSGDVPYKPESRICTIANTDFSLFFYVGGWIYFSTMTIIITSYTWILWYKKKHSFYMAERRQQPSHQRQRREVRIYFRLLTIICILVVMGFPYIAFFIFSKIKNYKTQPSYADRICHMSLCIGFGISMLLCLIFTDDVRKIVFQSQVFIYFGCLNRQRRTRRIACVTVPTT